jgi:hypothetical protein
MAEHYWLFPWFALVAGVFAALAGALVGGGLRRSADAKSGRFFPVSLIVVWLIVSAGLFLASLHLGSLSGVDFIAARGYLLGMASGLVLAWVAKRAPSRPNSRLPLLTGLPTATVAIGRLWLTHGEMSGLTALALSATVTLLCLCVAPALIDSRNTETDRWQVCRRGAGALLFLISLDAAVQLGFTKAGVMKTMYWADIPLLLSAALSLGALVGDNLSRSDKASAVLPIVCALVAGALAAIPLSLKVATAWEVATLPLLGAALFALCSALVGGEPADQQDASSHGVLAGLLLLVAGATVSFALWAGYGLALFVIGGWFTWGLSIFRRDSGAALERPSAAALGAFGLSALFLVYRLALLQNGESMRSRGPGDIWDLFAISLGAVLPWMVAEWSTSQARERTSLWLLTLQWSLAVIIPALVLEYIWRPRALGGLLLGVALGQILASVSATSVARAAAAAISGLLFSLVIMGFMPWFDEAESPTRVIRLVLVAVLAVLIVLRAIFPLRGNRSAAPVAQEG